MIAYLARTWPNLQYPLLLMAFLIFLVIGTLWLYIRPDLSGVLAEVRRHPVMVGLWLLVGAGALVVVYAIDVQ